MAPTLHKSSSILTSLEQKMTPEQARKKRYLYKQQRGIPKNMKELLDMKCEHDLILGNSSDEIVIFGTVSGILALSLTEDIFADGTLVKEGWKKYLN